MKYIAKPLDIEASEPQFTLYKEVTKYDEVTKNEITFFEPVGQICETSEAKLLQEKIDAKAKAIEEFDNAIADQQARLDAILKQLK